MLAVGVAVIRYLKRDCDRSSQKYILSRACGDFCFPCGTQLRHSLILPPTRQVCLPSGIGFLVISNYVMVFIICPQVNVNNIFILAVCY